MKYSNYIMRMLRQRKGLEKNDTEMDSILQGTEPMDALREVCAWKLGDRMWADTFVEWAKQCGVMEDD